MTSVRVRVVLALDIYPDLWSEDYGTETVAEVRDDVKRYIVDHVDEHLRGCNLGQVLR